MNSDRISYGCHYKLGWGIVEYSEDNTIIDFSPEFLGFSDIKYYWKNRKRILALESMTLLKYLQPIYWYYKSKLPFRFKSKGYIDLINTKGE